MEDILKQIDKDKIKTLSSSICNLSPLEFSTLGCIIAILICQTTTISQQYTLGNLLEMIGQILITNNAQATTIDPNYTSATITQLNSLRKEIEYLIKHYKITN